MNALDSLIKKRSAYKNFSSDADGKLNHAYLFICEDGVIRERLLTLCAKKIFCPSECGVCLSCKGIEEETYLDVAFFDGAKTKVSDVSAMTEAAMVKPVEGNKKLFIVDNADKLSAQAQNKLLKTYEEPPAYLTIILAAASENGILPTIKSRAKKLYFDGLTAKEAADYLVGEGADRRKAEIAAAIGDGNLEKAEFCLDSDNLSLYDSCFDLMSSLDSSAQIPEYVLSGLFSKDNVSTMFDIMEIILSDVLKLTTQSGLPLLNDGREYDVRNISKKYNAQSAAAALSAINEGRKMLNANVSATSCAEYVTFNILEARYRWR